jgi:serine/threonine-protein kinase
VVVVGLSLRACGGDERTHVPVVAAGSTVTAATAAITAAHLAVRTASRTSSTVPTGRVIGTDPAAGTALRTGAPVALLVSAGRPKVNVVSSAYVGRTAASVRDALAQLGLKPALAYDGTGGPAGTVRSVSPAGPLAYGSAVTIHVVPAPAPREEPRKRGKDKK